MWPGSRVPERGRGRLLPSRWALTSLLPQCVRCRISLAREASGTLCGSGPAEGIMLFSPTCLSRSHALTCCHGKLYDGPIKQNKTVRNVESNELSASPGRGARRAFENGLAFEDRKPRFGSLSFSTARHENASTRAAAASPADEREARGRGRARDFACAPRQPPERRARTGAACTVGGHGSGVR